MAEPSIDWRVLAAVAALGARRVLDRPLFKRRLAMAGVTWEDVAPALGRIRTLAQWARVFRQEAERAAEAGDYGRAASLAFLGHLVLSPHNPRKAELLTLMRRFHVETRSRQEGPVFERLSLAGGALVGYRETPASVTRLPVVLLPPLASTKEELALFADPLLAQGHPVLRLDLPGQGESPPPLAPDAEVLLARGLDEADVGPCLVGGVSLGAYYALRLAGRDPERRVRGYFGVSPPAIVTPEQWAKEPEVIYQYLDLYFGTATRAETLRIGLGMDLADATAGVECPVLLFHASRDVISLPDAPERYRAELAHVGDLTERIVNDMHGCLNTLVPVVVPEVTAWCSRFTAGQ